MIRHVLLAFSLAIAGQAEEEKKKVLTLDDPVNEWFPELELNEQEKALEEAWKAEEDEQKKQFNVGQVIDMYNNKVHQLTPQRKQEYEAYLAAKNEHLYGPETGAAMRCESQYKGDNKWSEQFIWDKKGYEDLGGALWIDSERYMKYVHNQPEKPWLLMMVKSPLGSVDAHYQTHEVVMHRIYCSCKAMGINFGLMDHYANEMIKESFYYNDGDYGFGVPYYVYLKDGKAVHIEQKLWQTAKFVAALKDAVKGEGHVVESRRAPRNSVNIFWEYAQRDIGREFNRKVTFPLLSFVEKDQEHPLWKFHERWFLGRTAGEKAAGFNIILMILVPILILKLLILRCMCKCLCRCCCQKKSSNDDDVLKDKAD